jgi:hypothetical protein
MEKSVAVTEVIPAFPAIMQFCLNGKVDDLHTKSLIQRGWVNLNSLCRCIDAKLLFSEPTVDRPKVIIENFGLLMSAFGPNKGLTYAVGRGSEPVVILDAEEIPTLTPDEVIFVPANWGRAIMMLVEERILRVSKVVRQLTAFDPSGNQRKIHRLYADASGGWGIGKIGGS